MMEPVACGGLGVGVVVLGGYVNALGVVRSLAATGRPVAVITGQPFDMAHRSRHVVAHLAAPWLDREPERLLALLLKQRHRWEGWVLLPSHDGALEALSRHRDALCRHYRVAAPPWSVTRRLLDKGLMGEAARAAGLRPPEDFGLAKDGCWERQDLTFPLVVKPLHGHLFFSRFQRKLFLVNNCRELRQAAELAGAAGLACQLQEWIQGADDQIVCHCLYVDRHGVASPGVTVRKRRQSPQGFGVARVASLMPTPPGLAEATLRLVRHLGWQGPVSAEFKVDPRDGSFRFIEINGRLVLYNTLLERGGLNLPALVIADHLELTPPAVLPVPWEGHWIHLHADLFHALLELRRGSITLPSLLAPYRRAWMEAVWRADDPLPFLLQWARTLREIGWALLQGRYGRLVASREVQGPGGRSS
jgi:D-aspartate ligase